MDARNLFMQADDWDSEERQLGKDAATEPPVNRHAERSRSSSSFFEGYRGPLSNFDTQTFKAQFQLVASKSSVERLSPISFVHNTKLLRIPHSGTDGQRDISRSECVYVASNSWTICHWRKAVLKPFQSFRILPWSLSDLVTGKLEGVGQSMHIKIHTDWEALFRCISILSMFAAAKKKVISRGALLEASKVVLDSCVGI